MPNSMFICMFVFNLFNWYINLCLMDRLLYYSLLTMNFGIVTVLLEYIILVVLHMFLTLVTYYADIILGTL